MCNKKNNAAKNHPALFPPPLGNNVNGDNIGIYKKIKAIIQIGLFGIE